MGYSKICRIWGGWSSSKLLIWWNHKPFPRSKIEEAIKHETELEANWQEFKVVLSEKIFDNFRTACSKAGKSCITSEISDHETIYEEKETKKEKFHIIAESSGSDLEKSSQGLGKCKVEHFICIYGI